MKRRRFSCVVVVLGLALAVARPADVRAQSGALRLADVQVESEAEQTEIVVGVPAQAVYEDRTRTRAGRLANPMRPPLAPDEMPLLPPAPSAEPPDDGMLADDAPAVEPTPTPAVLPWMITRPGAITVDEVRLFFPGVKLDRARAITVGDRIVEETRLFPEEGGVTMTVTVRRPVQYMVARRGDRLRVRLEPAVILVAQATPPPAAAAVPGATREPGEDAESGEATEAGEPGEAGAPGVAAEPGAVAEAPKAPKQTRIGGGGTGRSRRGGGLQGQVTVPTLTFQSLEEGEGLTVDAESLTVDRERNEVVAKGHVTIARAGALLTADEVRIHRDTRKAEATGNVQITDPQGMVTAEGFSGELEDETGVLRESTIYLAQNHLTISGQRMEKSFGQTYRIENGRFTTCDCGVGAPTWSIAGDEIDVTLDGYGFVKNAKLEVMDVPVLYLPRMAFPAKTRRQTGLLAPLLGFSKKRGFQYLQPLYIAINKSADATISADIETEARVGAIGEYRWAIDPMSKGTLNASIFDESLRNNAERDIENTNTADQDIPAQRWSVTSTVRHALPFETTAFIDALAVSDDFFLREIPTFSFDPEYERRLRTRRFTSSKGGFYKLFDRATVIGQAVYYQDFIQEDDLTFQRLPEVVAFGSQRFFERRLKLRLDGSAVNFEREEGFDGPRIDLSPRLEAPIRFSNYLRGKLGVSFRETAYHMNDKELVQPVSQAGGVQDPAVLGITELEDNPTRELFQADAALSTEVNRVFPFHRGGIEKIKHTIEPGISYRYVPDVDQDDQPIYDFVDRIDRRNRFTYGVTTRLLGKLEMPALPGDRTTSISVGSLNSFDGVAPSPFDDENTRGGLDMLGEDLPGAYDDAGTGEPGAPGRLDATGELDADRPAGSPAEQAAAERAARAREELSVLSHVAELARLQISQSYDLDQSLQTETDDKFSNVDVALRITPSHAFALTYGASFDPKEGRLDEARVGFTLRDPRPRSATSLLAAAQRASVGIVYHLISQEILEEVDGSIVVPLADTLSTFAQTRYNALVSEFLENRFGFRLTSQCRCWIFDLFVVDRINPDETEFRTQITLVGLGSIGRSR